MKPTKPFLSGFHSSFLPLKAFLKSVVIIFTFSFPAFLLGQGVGIGNTPGQPNPGAILDIRSNNKGVLLPRTDTSSITIPTDGMIIYDTLSQCFVYFNGARWQSLLSQGNYSFWWADQDGDGYGYPFNVIYSPLPPQHYVGNNGDCNDNDASIHPNASELCDGIDNDCDGMLETCAQCLQMCDDGDPCTVDFCVNGVCGHASAPAGTPCATGVCNGNGNCVECLSPTNCDDGNPCTFDICISGVCSHIPAPAGTPCPGGFCDGMGGCVQCLLPANCDDGDPCTVEVCINGVCGHIPVDCDDGNPCTLDICTNGVCSHIFAPNTTLCPTGHCNGMGLCIPF